MWDFFFKYVFIWLCQALVVAHMTSVASRGIFLAVHSFSGCGTGLVASQHVGSSQTRDWTCVPCTVRRILLFYYYFLNLQYCIGFAIHQHATATGVHVFPIPNPPSHLSPHTIPLGHPSAPAPSFLYPASNLDWHSFLIYYTCFNAVLPNHPPPSLSQSPKDCSIHQCLFCCLAYRVVITIFLNSIYMR